MVNSLKQENEECEMRCETHSKAFPDMRLNSQGIFGLAGTISLELQFGEREMECFEMYHRMEQEY